MTYKIISKFKMTEPKKINWHHYYTGYRKKEKQQWIYVTDWEIKLTLLGWLSRIIPLVMIGILLIISMTGV